MSTALNILPNSSLTNHPIIKCHTNYAVKSIIKTTNSDQSINDPLHHQETFFFRYLYNPLWVLAFSTESFQAFLFSNSSFQLLRRQTHKPSICWEMPNDHYHLINSANKSYSHLQVVCPGQALLDTAYERGLRRVPVSLTLRLFKREPRSSGLLCSKWW